MKLIATVTLLVCLAATALACTTEPGEQGDNADIPGPDVELPPAPPEYQAGTEIEIEGGAIAGSADGDLRRFVGIPYAAPPVGERRLRMPEAVEAWDGMRDATVFGPDCPQTELPGFSGPSGTSEDCLYLNVWAFDDGKKRPVMVFIHGGAYVVGSGSQSLYDGTALARRGDVVIVTINYRMGALGFLALESHGETGAQTVRGNYGLADQVAALEWVQRNISIFGGDPDNVTVFGESAGAISICSLFGVPAADGLYHRAILESAVACRDFITANDPNTSGQKSAYARGAEVLGALGCDGESDVRSCLAEVDVDEFVATAEVTSLLTSGGDAGLPFGPYVDGELFARQPLERVENGDIDVPVILGTNEDEATIFMSTETVLTRYDFEQEVAAIVGDEGLAEVIVELYPSSQFFLAKDAFLAFVSDALFSCPNLKFARALAASGTPTYAYEFQQVVPQMLALGSYHGLELPFIFGTFSSLTLLPRRSDLDLSEAIQRAWTSFAHNGEPQLATTWPRLPVEGGQMAVLDDDLELMATGEFRGGRCAALDELGLVP